MGSALLMGMRAHLNSKLIAALLAPALLASGAAQGLLFMRCGSAVRMSCCCPKEAPAAGSSSVTPGAWQSCGKLAVPSVPAQNVERVPPILSAPILFALGPSNGVLPLVEPVRQVPRLDPSPGPSPLQTGCALLI